MKLTERKLIKLCKEYRMPPKVTEKIVAEAMSKYANINFESTMYRLAGGGMERIFSRGDIELTFTPYIPGHPMGAGEESHERIDFDDGERVHVFHWNGKEERYTSAKARRLEEAHKNVTKQSVVKKSWLDRIFTR